jgi:hypothetical protein
MRTQVVSGLALHDTYDKLRAELQAVGKDLGESKDPNVIPREELAAWAARLDQVVIPP